MPSTILRSTSFCSAGELRVAIESAEPVSRESPLELVLLQGVARLVWYRLALRRMYASPPTMPPRHIGRHQTQDLAGAHLLDGIHHAEVVHQRKPARPQLVPRPGGQIPIGRVVPPLHDHVISEMIALP
jgi:hypothetical protein